jgi:hypothetical protein
MEKRDQRHAIEVVRRLQSARPDTDRDLLAAAFLHDCGKGRVPLWLRIVNVLAPAALSHVTLEHSRSWRGAAYRLREHARIGASLAGAAGASARTVRLIAGRPEPGEEDDFALLKAIDDAS